MLRDELEAVQARLAELKRLKERGFDLPQVQTLQQAEVLAAQARVEALRTQVADAKQALEVSHTQLVRSMEGGPLDPRALSPLERRLLLRIDGGRLVGAFAGAMAALTGLVVMLKLELPVTWLLPVALGLCAYNGWVKGRR